MSNKDICTGNCFGIYNFLRTNPMFWPIGSEDFNDFFFKWLVKRFLIETLSCMGFSFEG